MGQVVEQPELTHGLLLRLIDLMPSMVSFWDRDQHNVVSNREHGDFFGVSPEDLRGRHLRELIGEQEYDKGRSFFEAALAGEPKFLSVPLRDHRGRLRQVDLHYLPEPADPGGFYVLGVDVTERHELERSLRRAEVIAELGSWTHEVHEHEPLFSPGMCALLGRPPTWTPNWVELTEHIHPDDRERVLTTTADARTRAEGYELEYRLVQLDGRERTVRARCDVEQGPDGSVARRRGTELDVTEQRRSLDRLARLNQSQSDLIAMLGHDARQPLTAIRGHLENITDDWDDLPDDLKRHGIERSIVASRRLNELLDDVLTLVSLEARDDGSIPVRAQWVRVADVVADALDNAPEVTGVTTTVSGRPTARVDPWQLRQIVANLVGNALKYGEAPVRIEIATVTVDGDQVARLRVTDSGEGVPASFLPRLFGRFERAEEGVAATKKGTGFGLYIVRRLVEANGGSVRHDDTVGPGASFVVDLPVR